MEIIWVNGPFGVGKTTTAGLLVQQLPGARLYDPEEVGAMVRRLVPEQSGDWQHIPIWRPLVAATALQLHASYGGPLITPMTLLHQPYAKEIFDQLAADGFTLHHIVLTCDIDALRARIQTHVHFPDDLTRSDKIRRFRLSKLDAYRDALPWLEQTAHLVDTTDRGPQDIADHILQITGHR